MEATSAVLMTLGSGVGIVIGLLRGIFIFLDSLIYSLVAASYSFAVQMYDLDNLIANMGGVISTMKQTIYSFLAVVMFFSIAFSLLEMLVDPSKVEDKQKGMGKIVSNVIVCIILIIGVPFLFKEAYNLQTKVIEEKIIQRTLGFSEDENLGNSLALSCWRIFLKPNNDSTLASSAWAGVFNSKDGKWKILPLVSHINDARLGDGNGKIYELSYLWIASTIFGAYMLWTMIKFAIDVAYRALKLIVLEIMSPIAIISYIDPKSSKDGIFTKWVKEVFKTYLALFIRIFALAIASVIINEVMDKLPSKPFVENVIIILAIASFIKTAPKFFDGIFGTELSKDSDTKFGADMLKKLGGAAVAGAVGGATGYATAKKMGYNKGRGTWEGLKGGTTGGWKAAKSNDLMGLVKAGAGGDAMRKYYGLPNKADARKAQTEADLAKRSAQDFTAKKEEIAAAEFDKKELFGDGSANDKSFNKYLADSTDPADTEWKNRWAAAQTDEERRTIKREYADAKFSAAKGDPKVTKTLSKLSNNRSAQYRASYGTEAAIKDSLDPGGEIAQQWIKEEEWGRTKIVAEQEFSNWDNLVEIAQAKGGTTTFFCNADGSAKFESKKDLSAKMKLVTKQTDAVTGTVKFSYNGADYTSEADVVAAAGVTSARDLKLVTENVDAATGTKTYSYDGEIYSSECEAIGFKELDMGGLQDKRGAAKESIGFAEKKKDDASKAKDEAIKDPKNAEQARKAKLIIAGKARGY